MTSEAMSPLRRRIIEDMTVRKFVEKTQKDYIRYVKDLTAFLGRSPDTATAEDLRRYQLHLTNSGVHPPRINAPLRPCASSFPSRSTEPRSANC
jgi:integrase/recombinase XerD